MVADLQQHAIPSLIAQVEFDPRLGPVTAEVLALVAAGIKSTSVIADRLNRTTAAIRLHLAKLRRMGILSGDVRTCTIHPHPDPIIGSEALADPTIFVAKAKGETQTDYRKRKEVRAKLADKAKAFANRLMQAAAISLAGLPKRSPRVRARVTVNRGSNTTCNTAAVAGCAANPQVSPQPVGNPALTDTPRLKELDAGCTTDCCDAATADVMVQLDDHGVPGHLITGILLTHSLDVIRKKLWLIEYRARTASRILNPAGWLIRTFEALKPTIDTERFWPELAKARKWGMMNGSLVTA